MKSKSKKRGTFAFIGAGSLITIFAVLCIVIFAMLCITTVLADTRIANAQRESVKNYYEADCRAEEILAGIRAGDMPDGVKKDGDVYSYSCGISETQSLFVEVRVNGDEYEIIKWQAQPLAGATETETIEVWDGGVR